jgi:hypothetical protein
MLNDLKLHGARRVLFCHALSIFVKMVTLYTTHFNLKNIEWFCMSLRIKENNFSLYSIDKFLECRKKGKK